jgi:predicted ArsR family transcriptional regulator
MPTADVSARTVTAAIRDGAHTLVEIAAALGVNASSAALRHTLFDLRHGGILTRTDTGARSDDGHPVYRFDLTKPKEIR